MTEHDRSSRAYLLSTLYVLDLDAWTPDDYDEAISDARCNLESPGDLSDSTRAMWAGLLALLERARPLTPRTDDGGEVLDPAILEEPVVCAACAGQGSVYYSRADVRVPCNNCPGPAILTR